MKYYTVDTKTAEIMHLSLAGYELISSQNMQNISINILYIPLIWLEIFLELRYTF